MSAAAEFPTAPPEPLRYADDDIKAILGQVKSTAIVGISANEVRPSYFAAAYLQAKGYRIVPVNPRYVGQTILGETVYPDIGAIPFAPDMVQMFRPSVEAPALIEAAIAKGIRVFWMQLGLRHDAAARRAEAAGLTVVMDRCPKIEYGRLFGEIGWLGVNRGVISGKRGAAMQLKKRKGALT